jgi:hypothetical protein
LIHTEAQRQQNENKRAEERCETHSKCIQFALESMAIGTTNWKQTTNKFRCERRTEKEKQQIMID